jgi:hypothetical protein
MEGEEQQAHDSFPETVRDKAIGQLHDLLKGNGVSTDKLEYETIEGGLYQLEGYSRIEISYSRTQGQSGRKNRKESYQKVESREALEDAIEAARRELCEKSDKRKLIVKKLLQTRDQGFNPDGYRLDLGDFNCNFVLPSECEACHQYGSVTCQGCQGSKQIQCRKCHGATQITCPQCQGSAFVQGPNGRQQCQQCGGQGQVHCDKCRSSGRIACPKCSAQGRKTCQQCGGTGWHEEITHIAFYAETRLEYDTHTLPRGLVRILHKKAGDLAAGQALNLNVEEGSDQNAAYTIYVNYTGYIPYGKLHMRLKDKHLSALVYGHDARLDEVPPFLEHCCSTGIKELQKAADTPGEATTALETAGRYRLLRQALILSSQYKPRLALDKLAEQYPHGMRQATRKGIVVKSDQALRNVTKRPRLIGLLIGLVLSASVITGYYFKVQMHLPFTAPWKLGMVDLALVGLCCLLTSASIHLLAMRGLRRVFTHIAGNEYGAVKLQPKLDLSINTGVSATLGLYLAIVLTLAVISDKAPYWAKTALANLGESMF